jgi:hypothetical protein
MNVPGASMPVNVTRPLVTLDVTEGGVTFRVAPPWGWFIGPRHLPRTDVLAVRITGRGSWVSSGVQFDVPGSAPLTFWTTTPLEVLSALAGLGYPVEKPA